MITNTEAAINNVIIHINVENNLMIKPLITRENGVIQC